MTQRHPTRIRQGKQRGGKGASRSAPPNFNIQLRGSGESHVSVWRGGKGPFPTSSSMFAVLVPGRGHELFRLRNTLKGNPHTGTPCTPAAHWNPPGSARKGLYYARTADEIQTSNQSHHAESRQPGPGMQRNTEDFPVRSRTLLLKGSRALAR